MLHVRSNFEALVEQTLQDRGIEEFTPRYERKSIWRGKPLVRSYPLFAGYVFARFEFEARRPIVTAPGFASILGFGDQPQALTALEMEAVKAVALHPTVEPCPLVNEGDYVSVSKGPLAGVEGYVIFVRDHARVVLSVELLNRAVSAEVETAWLMKAAPPVKPGLRRVA